jgi:hypothetical protein
VQVRETFTVEDSSGNRPTHQVFIFQRPGDDLAFAANDTVAPVASEAGDRVAAVFL